MAFRFDLGTDLREFERTCGRDRLLAPVLERWRGMRVSAGQSLYEFLVMTTVLQNTVVRRSVQMMAALFGRLGRRVAVDGIPCWDGFLGPRGFGRPARGGAARPEARLPGPDAP